MSKKSWSDDEDRWRVDAEKYLAKTVHVDDERQWSGLYDANGRKLYRKLEGIGFVRAKDKQ